MLVLENRDVGAVRTALSAGRQGAERIGAVVFTRIIPGPHLDIEDLLPIPIDSRP